MAPSMEIISRERVKPSCPTPHHLRSIKLSFLDQIAPQSYIPLIFFYPADLLGSCEIERAQKYSSMKQSLSNTLTHFYPLAGRIKDDISIECDDTGVEYVEARVHAQLSQVIAEPKMEELMEYLAVDSNNSGTKMKEMSDFLQIREILLAIQVNIFDCGGMAIGVCISHIIADGASLVTFINAWAATSRGDPRILPPNFDTASLFPPRELPGFASSTYISKEKIVTKRFVFDTSTLMTLKEAASLAVGSEVKDPTRVEAVSAFIWKQFVEVAKLKMDDKKLFGVVHAVNFRPKSSPPFPEYAFGNLWQAAMALLTPESKKDDHDLVFQLRTAIRKIDSDYVKMLQTGDEYLKFLNKLAEQFSTGEVEFIYFSSWCRFSVYGVDFGWGKPIWVCTTTFPFKNMVILMSTCSGDGIEAWVNMLEDDIAKFELEYELLSVADNGCNA